MNRLLLGHTVEDRTPFYIPTDSLDTHWHLIGGTGKGKTTAIHTLLHGVLRNPLQPPCVFVIDRMGGLSFDLLRWIASPFCPSYARQRLVYIEPARDDVVLGFNPLLHSSDGEAYYKVARAVEIILRGWANQNVAEMPRLARWMFNCFFACALAGLTIADSVHLLLPGGDLHEPLLKILPDRLRAEWQELFDSNPAEIGRMLESARNRLKPFYEAPALRRMFGATTGGLNVAQFMRDKRVVILNLAPGNRIPEQIADAIGGLVLNEVLATARALPAGQKLPTLVILDEFQRFVGPDVEAAIPEVRQMRVKLVLSHQSMSQLKQGDYDLTTMIYQAQSRLIFGLQGEDADLLGQELASLQFDPKRIKDEVYSRRQRISGHELRELTSVSQCETLADNWSRRMGRTRSGNTTRNEDWNLTSTGDGTSDAESTGTGGSHSSATTHTTAQHLLPVHEDFWELVNKTYYTFDEDVRVHAREIRRLGVGEAFCRLVNQPEIHRLHVHRDLPGPLCWDAERLRRFYPAGFEAYEALLERNFASGLFSTPDEIERETQERLTRVLRAPLTRSQNLRETQTGAESPHLPFN